jgi:hypothetical protein
MKNPGYHSEGHRAPQRPDLVSPHRERTLSTPRTPDPADDPARSVALRAEGASDLDEDVFGQTDVEDSGASAASHVKEDDVRPPVEPGTVDGDAGQLCQLTAHNCGKPGYRRREHAGHTRPERRLDLVRPSLTPADLITTYPRLVTTCPRLVTMCPRLIAAGPRMTVAGAGGAGLGPPAHRSCLGVAEIMPSSSVRRRGAGAPALHHEPHLVVTM